MPGSFGSGSHDNGPHGTISTKPVVHESDEANGVIPEHAETEKNYAAPLNTSETNKLDLRKNSNHKILQEDEGHEYREMTIEEAEFEVKDYQDAHNRTTGGVFKQMAMHETFDDRPRMSEVHKLTGETLLQ